MIIAIDGPAGAGKSTVAEELARRHEIQLVDTGAMYRAVAYEAGRRDVELEDPDEVSDVAATLDFEFQFVDGDNVIYCNGEPLRDEIRTARVSRDASIISAHRRVREVLVEQQRQVGRERSSVLEGRDIGTVVFPNADVKIFITASREVRAQRRVDQMRDQGQDADYQEVYDEIEARDRRDREREIAPLKKADDAVEIVTDELSIEEVISAVEREIAD